MVEKISQWKTNRPMRNIAYGVLCVLFIFFMVKLVWVLLSPESVWLRNEAPSETFKPSGISPSNTRKTVDLLINAHLFGETEPTAPTQINATETTLNIELRGVYASDASRVASAIVQVDNEQHVYFVGEEMPEVGDAVLKQVLSDRIIFERNGRYEVLYLKNNLPDKSTQSFFKPLQKKSSGKISQIDKRNDAWANNWLQTQREKLATQPLDPIALQKSFARTFRVSPEISGEQLQGFRIRPGADRQTFKRLGLHRNDVLTHVNDIALNNPESMNKLLDSLKSAETVRLRLKRGNGEAELLFAPQKAPRP